MIKIHMLMTACTLFALGCGASSLVPPDLEPIRLAQIEGDRAPELPLLIEFKPGDELPLELTVSGDLIETEGTTDKTTLRVKRHFFVLLTEEHPPRISLDGKTLSKTPGSVSIGLGVSKEDGPRASVGLTLRESRE